MFDRRIYASVLFVLLLSGCAGNPSGTSESQGLKAAMANTQLGIEYLRQGEFDTSRRRLERAIVLAPDYPPAHDAIAVLYERVGERELAEKHYRTSLRLDPENGSAYNNYGQFLCQSSRFDEAEDAFDRAVNNPFYRTPWVPLTNAGICMLDVPENDRAEEYLRLALKHRPEYAPALINMAMISFSTGNYLGARAYVQRYQLVARHTAKSLWLAVRTEFNLKDHQAWGNYSLRLKNDFPDSEQTLLLQEWENERRSGT